MAKIFRTIFVVAVIMVSMLSFQGDASALSDKKDVAVIDNGVMKKYYTDAETVGAFLDENKITLEKNDLITPNIEDKIIDNYTTEIVIKRAIDVKIFIDDSAEVYSLSPGTNVGEVILVLEEKTQCKYDSNEKRTQVLQDGDEIHLTTVPKETVTKTELIPFATITEYDDTLPKNQETIVQEGKNGEKTVISEIEIIDDIKTNKIVSETVIKAPVSKIVKVGTKEVAPVNDSGNPIPTDIADLAYTAQFTMEATAYTAGPESTGKYPGDPGYGITATGATAEKGVVAVDPDVIPLGTKLYIENYGYAIAADTGGGINGNEIDLFYDSLDDALQFGRRDVEVYVLE